MSAALARFPDLPARMQQLPVDHRGFPVPWFVAWIDGEPHFPIADGRKAASAWRQNRCWVCGDTLGRVKAFVIGPMCAVNRVSSEPPSHRDCAQFSARNCPFLTKPRMKRVNGENIPVGTVVPGGEMITRNPGVALVWMSRHPRQVSDGYGGVLYNIGDPDSVEWYAEGRAATRNEVLKSIETGLPLLEGLCARDPRPDAARAELKRCADRAMQLVPA